MFGIIYGIHSDHNGINLEINDRKVSGKNPFKYSEIKQYNSKQFIDKRRDHKVN